MKMPHTKTFVNLTGKKFSRLTVLSYAGKKGASSAWNCVCECGQRRSVTISNLRSGRTKSCGCFAQGRNRTHGKARTPVHRAWLSMRDRCLRPKSSAFVDYGGRGISICKEWDTFEGFFADMGDPPEGFTIERVDVNGNYNKQNCRWADRTDQARNRRNCKFFTIEGKKVRAKEVAEILGVKYKTIMARIKYGWTDEEILSGVRAQPECP